MGMVSENYTAAYIESLRYRIVELEQQLVDRDKTAVYWMHRSQTAEQCITDLEAHIAGEEQLARKHGAEQFNPVPAPDVEK